MRRLRLGTSWLTAYSLVFTAANVKPGDTILVQGAGGRACPPRRSSWPTRPAWRCSSLRVPRPGAPRRWSSAPTPAFESGARLPRKVDAVIESVGGGHLGGHSVRSVRPGGTIAICGATTGDQPGAELTRVFFQDIRVQGNTMGSREDFARLLRFVEHADLHPVIDGGLPRWPRRPCPVAFARMAAGDVFGKLALRV